MAKEIIFSRRLWVILVGCLFCVILIVRSDFFSVEHDPFLSVQRARVLYTDNSRLSPDPHVDGLLIGRQTIEIELLSGNHIGQLVRIENTLSRFFNHLAEENMELLVHVREHDGRISYVDVFSHSRSTFIYIFIGLFLLVLIAVGRKKGLYSAISLLFTISLVVFLFIPSIIQGSNPVIMAIAVAFLTTMFSILVVSDISFKSLSAICGTLAGVAIAGVTSIIAGRFANISGMHMSHAQEIFHQAGRDIVISVPDLLFAGIIISALGAVIDVGMTISSSIFEIKEVDPTISTKNLYKRGMNIGRDIMGTMSNTLILAFAGSSLTIMVIIALYQLSYLHFINLNLLAVEIIQGVSASIGLILTVPVTAVLAAFLASDNKTTIFLRNKLNKKRGESK